MMVTQVVGHNVGRQNVDKKKLNFEEKKIPPTGAGWTPGPAIFWIEDPRITG